MIKERFLIVTAGIIRRENKILICRRPQGKRQAGYYEFPGGKLEEGEEPRQGLKRELREELGIETEIGKPYEVLSHNYDFGTVLLLFFEVKILAGEPQPLHHDDVVWVRAEDLQHYKFLEADYSLLQKLKEEF